MPEKNNTNERMSTTQHSKYLNVLIVDDDEVSSIYINELLLDMSKKIVTVGNGQDAIEYIKENNDMNLIMMDIKLPGMSGYETTRRIRKHNKDIVIIAQTSYALLGDRTKAIEAGCDEYISKPINQDILLNIISRLLLNDSKDPSAE
jgi:CheY-like chemotaxis protein